MHIYLGLPDLHDQSSLPMLKQVQAGIQRIQAIKVSKRPRIELPVNPNIIKKTALCQRWMGLSTLKAASFGQWFHYVSSFFFPDPFVINSAIHLSWEDVAVNDAAETIMLKIHRIKNKEWPLDKVQLSWHWK